MGITKVDDLVEFWERASFSRIPTSPGLVASGTLTPECFVGCFRNCTPYVRVQPVLRLLDTRGAGSNLHKALFTQLQVFARCNTQIVTDLLITFISTIIDGAKIEVTPESTPWSALSIGARGVGKEVFVRGIEVAQINRITRMGGVPLNEPVCLIAVGLERLLLAGLRLNTETPCSYPVAIGFSIDSLFANVDAGLSIAQTFERSFQKIDELWHRPEITLAMLGDIQTDIDFAFTTGTISHSYRQHLLRMLRGQYRMVVDGLVEDTSMRQDEYIPRWTIDAIIQLNTKSSSFFRAHSSSVRKSHDQGVANVISSESSEFKTEDCTLQVSPNSFMINQSTVLLNELRFLQEYEWRHSPDTQCALAEYMRLEDGGSHLLRMNRVRNNSVRILEHYGFLNNRSLNILNRCVQLSQLEESSFIAKAIPYAATSNLEAYLRHWDASVIDMNLFKSRVRIRGGDVSLKEEPVEILCFAFSEQIELLLCKLAFTKLRYTSSADPGRIKHHSKQIILLSSLVGLDDNCVKDAYDEIGTSLGLSQQTINRLFADTYKRFKHTAS